MKFKQQQKQSSFQRKRIKQEEVDLKVQTAAEKSNPKKWSRNSPRSLISAASISLLTLLIKQTTQTRVEGQSCYLLSNKTNTNYILCADWTCQKSCNNISAVPLYCHDSQNPYQCFNGNCTTSHLQCATQSAANNENMTCMGDNYNRCDDGYCRLSCNSIVTSNCPLSKPLRCGDNRCVPYEYQCVSYSKCNLSQPFGCPDMTCQPVMANCTQTLAGRSFNNIEIFFPKTMNNTNITRLDIITQGREFGNNLQVEIDVPLKAFGADPLGPFKGLNLSRNKVQPTFSITSVGLRDIMDVENKINTQRMNRLSAFYQISGDSLPYHSTVRSSVVSVVATGRFDNNEYFEKPIRIKFNYNEIKTLGQPVPFDQISQYLCLGEVLNNNWTCASSRIIGFYGSKNSSSGFPMIEYNIPGPGIFAVILRPKLPDTDSIRIERCGFMCDYKRTIIISLAFMFPIFILFSVLLFKVCMLFIRRDEEIEKSKDLVKEFKKLDDLTLDEPKQLIKDKLYDKFTYMDNPLHREREEDIEDLRRLNTEIERLSVETKRLSRQKKKYNDEYKKGMKSMLSTKKQIKEEQKIYEENQEAKRQGKTREQLKDNVLGARQSDISQFHINFEQQGEEDSSEDSEKRSGSADAEEEQGSEIQEESDEDF